MIATLISLAITAFVILIVYLVATTLIDIAPYSNFIKWGINNIGSGVILFIVGVSLFLAIYNLLSRPIIRNLQHVQQSLKQMSEGSFQTEIIASTNDEISVASRYVHDTATELNHYLDEMVEGLELMAEGKLDHTIPVKKDHKLGEVAESINEMAVKLRRSIQEERSAEQSKNDLITGVSHDLRTPLTSILGFLEVIKQDRYRDEVELMYYVDIAHSKAEHLKHLIDDLFEFTRMNNGMPLASEALALDDLLRQLMEEYVPIMKDSGITGRLILEQQRIQIFADGDLLIRALVNIVNNAMQYGKDGKYIDIALNTDNDQVIVSISNYGNPIPTSELPFIFDRFYRVEKSRSLQTGGTGLGLSIAKTVIELHKGKIWAESDMHRTSFKMSFPLLEKQIDRKRAIEKMIAR